MGEHILPRQVLSSTSTICQIFNSEEKKAVVIDENDQEINFPNVTEATLSQYVNINQSGKKYKRVDIYWPMPMLKVIFFIIDLTDFIFKYRSQNLYFNHKGMHRFKAQKVSEGFETLINDSTYVEI